MNALGAAASAGSAAEPATPATLVDPVAVDPAAAVLAALQLLGSGPAPRFNPTRWHYLQALARRLAARQGPVRAVLAQRLAQAMAAYTTAQAQAQAQAKGEAAGPSQPQAECAALPIPGALASLVGRLNRGPAGALPAGASVEGGGGLGAGQSTQVELKAVQQFRSTWARLSVDRQLARSQAQVPDNPGPLNSHLLVLRALQEMQAVSPACLGHFMAYADALLWLDQATGAGASSHPGGVRRESKASKPARAAAVKRQP